MWRSSPPDLHRSHMSERRLKEGSVRTFAGCLSAVALTVQTDGSHFKVRSSSTFEKSIARLRTPGSPTGTCDGRLKQLSTSSSLPTQREARVSSPTGSFILVPWTPGWCDAGLVQPRWPQGLSLFSLCRLHRLQKQ